MATFGKVSEFKPEEESIEAYLERVQLFIEANGVKADKKVAVLLSVIGSKTYSNVRDLVSPARPDFKSYDNLVGILKKHFNPKPLVIAQRFYFHQRAQAESESISDYLAELKKLAWNCEFGQHLDEALRNRLFVLCRISQRNVDYWQSRTLCLIKHWRSLWLWKPRRRT